MEVHVVICVAIDRGWINVAQTLFTKALGKNSLPVPAPTDPWHLAICGNIEGLSQNTTLRRPNICYSVHNTMH